MNTREIKSEGSKVVSKLLSIFPKTDVKDYFLKNTFIAGGYVRDLLRNKRYKDIDFYFKSKEAMDLLLPHIEKAGYRKSKNGTYVKDDIQFITMIYGDPESVINKFDFTVNQGYYDYGNSVLNIRESSQNLYVNKDGLTPLGALIRVPYLLDKGFHISKAEMAFLSAIVMKLPLPANQTDAKRLLSIGSEDLLTEEIKSIFNLQDDEPSNTTQELPSITTSLFDNEEVVAPRRVRRSLAQIRQEAGSNGSGGGGRIQIIPVSLRNTVNLFQTEYVAPQVVEEDDDE